MRRFLESMDWDNWLYGLIAGFIGGGANAVTSSFTAAMIYPTVRESGVLKFLELLAATFIASGTYGGLMYLKQNNLPARVVATTRVQVTEQGDQPVKTVTTKEETKVSSEA